jgi:leader peptidase (prepilin peptidase)/N-methyltransferase
MTLETRIFIAFAAALFGAVVGSFLNVCIYRLPREGLGVGRPRRSFCPACGSEIAWYDNVPIASWMALRGRCRRCQSPISARYPFVEALTAVLYVAVAWRYLLSGEVQVGTFAVVLLLVSALVVAAFIDMELRIIPDEITLRGMALAPFLGWVAPELHESPDWGVDSLVRALEGVFQPIQGHLPAWLGTGMGLAAVAFVAAAAGFALGRSIEGRIARRGGASPAQRGTRLLGGVLGAVPAALLIVHAARISTLQWPEARSTWATLLGMACGAGLVQVVGVVGSKVFRKPAMGFGDVKLMGLLGAFTGWLGVVQAFFLACILGSIVGVVILVRSRSRYLPFGPFLALGSLFVLLAPKALGALARWYMGLFA